MHQKNVQLLMTEMFKTNNNLNPSVMNEIFQQRSATYNLRNTFLFPMIHAANHVAKAIQYRGQRICTLSQEIRDSNSVLHYNLRIKSNIGTMSAATVDFAGSAFLDSAFYSLHYFDMNFAIWYKLCNFIDLFYLYIFFCNMVINCWLELSFLL